MKQQLELKKQRLAIESRRITVTMENCQGEKMSFKGDVDEVMGMVRSRRMIEETGFIPESGNSKSRRRAIRHH